MLVFEDRVAFEAFLQTKWCEVAVVIRSTMKGTSTPQSDIDLLVAFEESATPTLLDLARMEFELSGLLEGRKVDLRTAKELSRYFRDKVVATAVQQYAA